MNTQSQTGSVLGGALLVSGCSIGAAMLGLPALSAFAGFQPSFIMFGLSWLFMVCTGFLVLEVTLWFDEEISFITMADRTLGWIGKAACWILFLFLFYSLMVAYVSGSGLLLADFTEEIAGIILPQWVGSVAVTALFGVLIYFGTHTVDTFNRFLMFGLIATYLLLVILGLPHIKMELLQHKNWEASIFVLPAMIISFGFHNLVPTLKTYLQGDVKRLRRTILIGSVIPLIIYLLWELVILGIVPIEGNGGFLETINEGKMATSALRKVVGSAWVVNVAEYFSFFAIVTSFLTIALSIVDFLADGLHVEKTPKGKTLLCGLVLLPPLAFALLYKNVFLMALSYAGAFGAVILFGILPAAMVWKGRYQEKLGKIELVRGGKVTLALIVISSLFIMILGFLL